MKLEGVIHCEGPDCYVLMHVGAVTMEDGRLPGSWLRVIEYGSDATETAYCGWNCLMKAAAEIPPPEVIDGPDALGDQ